MSEHLGLKIAAGITVVSMGIAGVAAYEIEQSRKAARSHKQIAQEVIKDGFTAAHDIYGQYSKDGRNTHATIGSLLLGNCTFSDVDFTRTETGGSVETYLDSYRVVINQLNVGTKFESDAITLKFTNAVQLERELPTIDCIAS